MKNNLINPSTLTQLPRKVLAKLLLPMLGTIGFFSHSVLADEAIVTEPAVTEAAEVQEPSGMISEFTGFEINELSFLKATGITVGAWISFGGSYNPDADDGFNGVTTFVDDANSFTFNQFNLFFERAVNKEGGVFDLGFRADLMVGNDARFTQAYGLDDQVVQDPFDGGPKFIDFAAPNLYLEAFIPVGNGLTAKIGHFYTPIGYEVVPANGNFFLTHAYTMQYGEPFTHTGVLFSYPVLDNFSITAGALNGWDNWDENPSRFSGLFGMSWSGNGGNTSATITGIAGDDNSPGTVSGTTRAMYSLVLTHKVMENLTWVLQHDNGWLENGDVTGVNAARWYGINNYLFYDVNEQFSLGLRGEWFNDADGVRVCGIGFGNASCPGLGNGGEYYEVTLGVNWKPKSWLNFRPEVRYDWVDQKNAVPFGVRPFDGGTGSDQFLFSIDTVIKF